jgi:hypothetical protein
VYKGKRARGDIASPSRYREILSRVGSTILIPSWNHCEKIFSGNSTLGWKDYSLELNGDIIVFTPLL